MEISEINTLAIEQCMDVVLHTSMAPAESAIPKPHISVQPLVESTESLKSGKTGEAEQHDAKLLLPSFSYQYAIMRKTIIELAQQLQPDFTKTTASISPSTLHQAGYNYALDDTTKNGAFTWLIGYDCDVQHSHLYVWADSFKMAQRNAIHFVVEHANDFSLQSELYSLYASDIYGGAKMTRIIDIFLEHKPEHKYMPQLFEPQQKYYDMFVKIGMPVLGAIFTGQYHSDWISMCKATFPNGFCIMFTHNSRHKFSEGDCAGNEEYILKVIS